MTDVSADAGFLSTPHLPTDAVTALLIGENAGIEVFTELSGRGIHPVVIGADDRWPKPIADHADIQYHHLGDADLITADPGSKEAESLRALGFHLRQMTGKPDAAYPADAALDAARIGGLLFCHEHITEPIILADCRQKHIRVVHVRQGYAKCSVCVADEQSIITSDPSIETAAHMAGLHVLKIRPGHIRLPGYDTGFIGGCCGKLGPHEMAFFGDLSSHPDYDRIIAFLSERSIAITLLGKGELRDIGGFIPLTQRKISASYYTK